MIEVYAFSAMFLVQIFAASVLYPAWIIKYVRGWARDFGSESFAQKYPGADYSRWAERFATVYRAATIVIALLGALLLYWLLSDVHRPDWADHAKAVLCPYFLLQLAPLALLGLYGVLHYKVLKPPPLEVKRSANLKRRGLFDFVPPFVVFLAVLSYFLFVAFALYVDLHVYQNPAPSRYCYASIGFVTALYALHAFIVYKHLYGKRNPLMTNEGRAHSIGMAVKTTIYGGITTVWFFMLFVTLGLLHLQRWEPCALSAFFVIMSLVCVMGITAPSRRNEAAREVPAVL